MLPPTRQIASNPILGCLGSHHAVLTGSVPARTASSKRRLEVQEALHPGICSFSGGLGWGSVGAWPEAALHPGACSFSYFVFRLGVVGGSGGPCLLDPGIATSGGL